MKSVKYFKAAASSAAAAFDTLTSHIKAVKSSARPVPAFTVSAVPLPADPSQSLAATALVATV